MVKIFFEIHRAPSEIPGQFSLSGQIFLHCAAVTLKGLGEFQNKKKTKHIRDFTIYFKNVDSSPLMK